MGPMTERFEMRLDADILSQIDAWRADQPDLPARAEAIRRLVHAGLRGFERRGELRLDKAQMLTIWLLTEVLKHTKGHEEHKTIKLIQQAIYGGHLWALDWEMPGVLHNHADSRENVSFVVDVLDMWEFIEEAWEAFDQAARDQVIAEVGDWLTKPHFTGFDGNNETELMSIARFLIDDMGRFSCFKGRSMNSHCPMVARYRQMFRLFEPMRAKLMGRTSLSVSEVVALLKTS